MLTEIIESEKKSGRKKSTHYFKIEKRWMLLQRRLSKQPFKKSSNSILSERTQVTVTNSREVIG